MDGRSAGGRVGSRSGLSLTEIVVCLGLLAMISTPLFDLFATSRRLGVSARDLDEATDLASSYLSALAALDATSFREFGPLPDGRLPPPFSPASLGLAPTPPPYRRIVTLLEVRKGPRPVPLWHAVVTVERPARKEGAILRTRFGRFLR